MFYRLCLISLTAWLIAPLASASQHEQCQSLLSLKLEHAEVISADYAQQSCRVVTRVWPAGLSQSRDSFIDVSTWMPDAQHWNGRFIGLGNGGYSPRLPQEQMQARLAEGFSVGASDTGHKTESLDFILAANERIDYWGRTAVHTLSAYSKKVITAYYTKPADYAYFAGCSTGGHQALAAAQYYPNDYDGILAGAPGNNRVALNGMFLWLFQQTHNQAGELLFERDDLVTLQQFNLERCDAADGQQDGLLSQPLACKPDYQALRCQGDNSQNCLSGEQITRVERIYAGPVDPKTGKNIYPGFPPGSELVDGYGWMAYWADRNKPDMPARADFWQHWVFDDPNWKPWSFDWHADFNLAQSRLSARIDATQTDISPFLHSGGKLLMYHGLADPIVSAADTLAYYRQALLDSAKGDIDPRQHMQLYLVAGMAHCGGGSGTNSVNFLPELIDWVEQQRQPQQAAASRRIKDQPVQQVSLLPYVE